MKRVGIYIDTLNLWYAAKSIEKDAKINYDRLIKLMLAKDRKPVVMRAYVVHYGKGQWVSFEQFLLKTGFDVRTKIVSDNDKFSWCIGVSLDIYSELGQWDVLCLGADSNGYADVVRKVIEVGKKVEIYSFPGRIPDRLTSLTEVVKLGKDVIEVRNDSD